MNKQYQSDKPDWAARVIGTALLALNLYLAAGEFIRWTN